MRLNRLVVPRSWHTVTALCPHRPRGPSCRLARRCSQLRPATPSSIDGSSSDGTYGCCQSQHRALALLGRDVRVRAILLCIPLSVVPWSQWDRWDQLQGEGADRQEMLRSLRASRPGSRLGSTTMSSIVEAASPRQHDTVRVLLPHVRRTALRVPAPLGSTTPRRLSRMMRR